MELLLGAALLQVSLGTLTLGDFVGKALVVYCPSRLALSLSIAYLEHVLGVPMTSVTASVGDTSRRMCRCASHTSFLCSIFVFPYFSCSKIRSYIYMYSGVHRVDAEYIFKKQCAQCVYVASRRYRYPNHVSRPVSADAGLSLDVLANEGVGAVGELIGHRGQLHNLQQ